MYQNYEKDWVNFKKYDIVIFIFALEIMESISTPSLCCDMIWS
jgi:hypothetical protein